MHPPCYRLVCQLTGLKEIISVCLSNVTLNLQDKCSQSVYLSTALERALRPSSVQHEIDRIHFPSEQDVLAAVKWSLWDLFCFKNCFLLELLGNYLSCTRSSRSIIRTNGPAQNIEIFLVAKSNTTKSFSSSLHKGKHFKWLNNKCIRNWRLLQLWSSRIWLQCWYNLVN